MITMAKWTVILFGALIIAVGFLMLLAPEKARATLRKAGSTHFINYAEITLRLITAIAMIVYADHAKFPDVFMWFGWFMLGTSLVLYGVPRQLHHNFSLQSAKILTPLFVRLLAPLAFLFGAAIIYNVL